jgi:molecular chaperone HtpG
MKAEQKKIYYLIADSYQTAQGSPLLEAFSKRDIEVLLLKDRVDEWLVAHLTEFEGKTLQSISKGELDLADLGEEKAAKTEEEKQETEKQFSNSIDELKKVLSERVKDVRLTDRLIDSPACVVYDDQDSSGHLQRLMAASGQAMPPAKPILELNPEHKLVSQLIDMEPSAVASWSEILLGQALLAEGEQLADPQAFISQVNALLESRAS